MLFYKAFILCQSLAVAALKTALQKSVKSKSNVADYCYHGTVLPWITLTCSQSNVMIVNVCLLTSVEVNLGSRTQRPAIVHLGLSIDDEFPGKHLSRRNI